MTIAETCGLAIAASNSRPNCSADVPPLTSVIMFMRGAMTPESGSTAIAPCDEATGAPRIPSPTRARISSGVKWRPAERISRMSISASSFSGSIAHGVAHAARITLRIFPMR
jgi:hypothetical protein